jgi:hypothetical protein
MTTLEKTNLRNEVLNQLKKAFPDNENYVKFIEYLFIEKGFINYVDIHDFKKELMYSEGEYLVTPWVTDGKVAFIIEIWEDSKYDTPNYKAGDNVRYIRFALDPKDCWNKTKHCSVQAIFKNTYTQRKAGMSKREYGRLIQMLDKIFDKKSELRKDWLKKAGGCWGAEYGYFE